MNFGLISPDLKTRGFAAGENNIRRSRISI